MNITFVPNIYFLSNQKFNSFKKDMKSTYHTEEVNKVIDEVVSNPKNIIGEGSSKIAYTIPGIEKFVIAKLKNAPHINKELESCDETLTKYNFGEPIATNGSDLIVMEKVEGVSHSIPNWINTFLVVLSGGNPTIQESKIFLSEIKKIEKFPIEAYIDLAQKIKYLSDSDIKMDSGNPNNILVDYKNKKFNLIDQMEHQDWFVDMKYPKNTTQDMISLLLDGVLHRSFLEQLNDNDRQVLISSSRNIIKKCKLAGKIAGLENDNTNLLRAHEMTEERHGVSNIVELYNGFIEIYEDNLF